MTKERLIQTIHTAQELFAMGPAFVSNHSIIGMLTAIAQDVAKLEIEETHKTKKDHDDCEWSRL